MAHGIKVWNTYSQNVFPSPTNIYAWLSTATTNACTFSADSSTTGAISGSVPLKMVVTGNDPYIACYNGKEWDIDIASQGETWTLSCYVKASQATNGELFIFGSNSAGTVFTAPTDFSSNWVNITTTWTRVSFTYTFTQANTRGIQIRLDGTPSGGNGITIWFDGLQLERAGAPTTFNNQPADAVLVNNMLGGRVGYAVATASYGVTQSYVFNDIPGHQYVKYFVLQAGAHTVSLTTENGCAKLTLTHFLVNFGFTQDTRVAVFATKTTNPTYGISVTNADGEILASTNYLVPVYRGKITFPSSYENPGSTLIRRHFQTVSLGDSNSYKLIFYTIPESTNVWFTGDTFIDSGSSSYTVNTYYTVSSGSFGSYSLAEGFVFQLNNLTTDLSTHTYGVRLYNTQSPQRLTLDSGSKHLNLKGDWWSIDYDPTTEQSHTGYRAGAVQTLDASNNVILSGGQTAGFSAYTAVSIPQYIKYTSTRRNAGENLWQINLRQGYYRRQGTNMYTKAFTRVVGYEDGYVDFDYGNYGIQYGNKAFVLDTKLLGGAGTGGSGATGFVASISEGSTGTKTCTYDSSFASNCTSSRDYTANTSNTSGPVTYRWHFGIDASTGAYIDSQDGITFQNNDYTSATTTLTRTAATGTTANAVLFCAVTNQGVTVSTSISVQFTFTAVAATTTITAFIDTNYTTSSSTFNEGTTIYFRVNTTNVPSGTYYWTLNQVNSQPVTADFTNITNPSPNGSFSINYGVGYFNLAIRADELSEGNETFTIQIKSGSATGTNVGNPSGVITIVDTSTEGSDYLLYFSPTDGNTINGGTSKSLIFEYIGAQSLAALPTFSISSDNANLTLSPTSGTLNEGGSFEGGVYFPSFYKTITATAANISSGNVLATVTARSPNGGTIRKTKAITIQDVVRPSVTISAASTSVQINNTTTITITFSKSVTGFTSGEVTTSIGTLSSFSGSGTTYTCTFTAPGSGGTANINVAENVAQDANGNLNTAATQVQITVTTPTFYSYPTISNLSVSPSYTAAFNETTRTNITWTFDVTDNAYSYNQRYIDGTSGGAFIGAKCYWAVEGGAGTSGDDFTGNISGEITSIDGTVSRSVSVVIKGDQTTEGTTVFRINFYRNGAYVGTPFYTTEFYDIADTSTGNESISLASTSWIAGTGTTLSATGTPSTTFNYSIDAQGASPSYNLGPLSLNSSGQYSAPFGSGVAAGSYTLNVRFTAGNQQTRSQNFTVSAASFDLASVAVYQLDESNNIIGTTNTIVAGNKYKILATTNGVTRASDTNIKIVLNQVYPGGGGGTNWLEGDYTYPQPNSGQPHLIVIAAGATTGEFIGRLGPEQGNRTGTVTISGGTGAPAVTSRSATITFTGNKKITGYLTSDNSQTVVPTSSGVAGVIVDNVAWFTFTVTSGSGSYTIDTNNSQVLSSVSAPDTEIAVYNITGARIGNNDDIGTPNYRSSVTVSLTNGQTYWVGIAHYNWIPASSGWTIGETNPSNTLSSMQEIRLSIAPGSTTSSPYSPPSSDTTPPTMTITGSTSVTAATTITFTSSESTSNFALADIGGTGAAYLSNFSGNGTTYTATYTPPSNASGSHTFSVAANAFTDAAGNGNTASNTLTVSYNTVTGGGAAQWYALVSNTGEQNGTTSAGLINQWYKRSVVSFVYSAAEITAATGKSSGTIQQIRFYITGAAQNNPFPSYTIGMKNITTSEYINPGASGWTTVSAAQDRTFNTTGYYTVDIADFSWTGNNLAFVMAWGAVSNYSQSGQSRINSSSGYLFYSQTDNAGTYTIFDTTVSSGAIRPIIEIYI
jgi:hypothetical protein